MTSQQTATYQYMEVHSWQQLWHNYSSQQVVGYNMPNSRSIRSNHSLVDTLHMVGNSSHCSNRSQEEVDNRVALLANLLDRHNLLQAYTVIHRNTLHIHTI